MGNSHLFGFLKRRRAIAAASTKIGVALHRQIKEALDEDESRTGENLSTAFVVGYIHWFVRLGFSTQGIDAERLIDKELRVICNGVMPSGKLYEIFERQLAALEIAKGLKDQNRVVVGKSWTPAQMLKLFETGSEVGLWDGTCIRAQPNNLKRYLLGQEMQYRRLKSIEEAGQSTDAKDDGSVGVP